MRLALDDSTVLDFGGEFLVVCPGCGARLRAETDLVSVAEDLLEVMDDTFQPEHVALWLKQGVEG